MICSLCSGDMTKPHTVTTTGLLEGEWDCHQRCYDEFMVGFLERRAQFEELIAAGVPNDEANRIMIARMNDAPPS